MGPHTMAPGGKRIRSDGGQARPPWAKGPRGSHTTVAQGDGGGQDAGQRSARLPSRQRDAPSPGHDPGMWPPGRGERGGVAQGASDRWRAL